MTEPFAPGTEHDAPHEPTRPAFRAHPTHRVLPDEVRLRAQSLLEGVPLFSEVPLHHLRELARYAHTETFAAGDPSLRLDQVALPPGEVATRDAIARTKTKELLKPFNSDFEWYLLLTQAEALSYGWHLAVVAAGNVQRRERAIYLTALGDQLKELYQQTVALMKARAAGRPKTTKTTP